MLLRRCASACTVRRSIPASTSCHGRGGSLPPIALWRTRTAVCIVASQWPQAWNVTVGLIRGDADQALDHADSLAWSQAGM